MAIAASPRWRIFAPLISVIVAFALWSGYWLWASNEAQIQVKAARVDLARQGLAIACDSESHGGYPFRLSFTCNGMRADGRDGTRVTAATIEALAQAWDPRHLIVLARGPASLTLRDGTVWKFSHDSATASLLLQRAGLRASLLVEHLLAEGPGNRTLAAKRLNLHVRMPERSLKGETATPPSLDAVIEASGLDLVVPGRQPLRIDTLRSDVVATALPLPLPDTLREVARAASTAGSELRLTRFDASTEGVDVEAAGSLRIEPTGLPAGRISMRFNDVKLLFSRLAERGLMTAKAADGTAVLVGLITTAGRTKDMSGPVDLLFKDGSVFWGPFRLATHGPLF